ncbi:putative 6-phosphogluconate dehydrogenase protein [Seiridium cardinale]|uniref:6-phosphogluconate dehydrogenase protein n=1 Tax=Seiridium cardinale TaxID=138064 RepID=A0ABR2XPP0_9PEZI
MGPQIAYIGLGNIGRSMSANLVAKGRLDGDKPLILYNRTASRAAALSEKLGSSQTKVATTVEDAVKPADIIFICLASDKAFWEVMSLALRNDVVGKVFVEVSSLHPDTAKELGAMVTAKGGEFVLSPVWSPPSAAEQGQLIAALAGPAKFTDKIRPYLEGVTCRAIVDFSGQDWSKACLTKVVGNTFLISMSETLGQGLTLAEKSGLGVDKLFEWVQILWPGPYVEYATRMVQGQYHARDEPQGPVDMVIKDATHALDLGEATGTKLYNMELGLRHLEGVKKRQGAKGDMTGIYGMIREESGLPFENDV